MDYWDIVGLECFYFEDSFVLGILEKNDALAFDMDIILTEKHPQYSPPKADERYCYLRGKLIFSGCSKINWINKTMRPSYSLDGTDYGNVDIFTKSDNGVYSLEGEWGEIEIQAEEVKIDHEE